MLLGEEKLAINVQRMNLKDVKENEVISLK